MHLSVFLALAICQLAYIHDDRPIAFWVKTLSGSALLEAWNLRPWYYKNIKLQICGFFLGIKLHAWYQFCRIHGFPCQEPTILLFIASLTMTESPLPADKRFVDCLCSASGAWILSLPIHWPTIIIHNSFCHPAGRPWLPTTTGVITSALHDTNLHLNTRP